MIAGLMALCCFGQAGPLSAQTCNFGVSTIAFGNIDTLVATNQDASGSVSVSCSGLLSRVEGTISVGTGSGGASGSLRLLQGSGSQLSFQLYKDAARSQVLGNGTAPINGTSIAFSSGSLLLNYSFNVPFYGRVFGGQTSAPPGSYLSTFSGADFSIRYRTCTAIICGSFTTTTLSTTATATVLENCLVSASDIDFGLAGSLAQPVTANGSVFVRCTFSTSFQVGLDAGQNSPGAGVRAMKSAGGQLITYELFQDAPRTIVWGNVPGSDTVGGTGSAGTITLPVYGRVPAQVTPPAATYTDVIVVTVTY